MFSSRGLCGWIGACVCVRAVGQPSFMTILFALVALHNTLD